ncbi:MAG: PAS domain S-box protein [Burkholderiales bacterium]
MEAYLRDLLNSMPDASFLVNSTGGLVLVNGLTETMFGYEAGELRGKSIDTLIPERFRRVHADHCSDYFARPRNRPMGVGLSLRALRKDGAEVPVEISLSPIQTDQGTFVLGAIRDVSQSEERYRAIFEQVAVGVVHSNSEGRLLNVNPKFCEISGYAREEALALDIHELTHADDIEKSVDARVRLLAGTSSAYEREARVIRKGGTEIWAHITTSLVRGADGRPVHFISLIHDISAQKRAEQQRLEIELRFRQVTENIREVFWLTDPAKNEILYVSPAYEGIWGRSAQAVYSSPRDWLDAVHPGDRDRVLEAAQTRQTTGDYDEEYRIVRPDGRVRWIWDRAFPVRDEGGRVIRVAGVAEDITERKHAADKLRESERRFSEMLQNVELVAMMLDRDARITYCNDYLLRVTGWTREEVSNRNWLELFLPPEIRDELKGIFASLLADLPDAWHHENEILTRSRERRLIRWNNTLLRSTSGEVVGTASIGEDITERKRTELALQESEGRFRAMIEQSISGTCIIDAEQRFAYVNPRLALILGYESAASITDRPVLEFVEPEDHPRVVENMRQRMAGEAQSARYHFRAIRKDGSHVTLEAHGTIGWYAGQRVVIATVQDVTELRRAEEEIEHTVAKLQRAVQSAIEVVSTIGELRDPYTHGHERRVGEIATAIAIEMGLPADRIEGIRVAGYLHDVGKIAVPAEILSKPTRLSKIEYELVKAHAQQSYEILKGMEFPWPVAESVWQHHERLDGSGYPRGLKNDEIILDARILAVADTVEAMASHRPYRAALGLDAALTEIESNRGKLYDPTVVDACLQLFRVKGYRLPA